MYHEIKPSVAMKITQIHRDDLHPHHCYSLKEYSLTPPGHVPHTTLTNQQNSVECVVCTCYCAPHHCWQGRMKRELEGAARWRRGENVKEWERRWRNTRRDGGCKGGGVVGGVAWYVSVPWLVQWTSVCEQRATCATWCVRWGRRGCSCARWWGGWGQAVVREHSFLPHYFVI